MSAFKVKLTPLTPISVPHPEPPLLVERKQDLILKTTPTDPTPDLSALLDWRYNALSSQLPSTPEELNMMFSSHFPIFGSFMAQSARGEQGSPDFQSEDYDALVEAFCADEHPLSLTPPQELVAGLWELTESFFSKSEFLPEAQENRIVEFGFDEFAAFGIDFDQPPQSPSEGSSDDSHGSRIM